MKWCTIRTRKGHYCCVPRRHPPEGWGMRAPAAVTSCEGGKVAAGFCTLHQLPSSSSRASKRTCSLQAARGAWPCRPRFPWLRPQMGKTTTPNADTRAVGHEPSNSPFGEPTFQGTPPPNQQKVAKDAPLKSRRPRENFRFRAPARPQVVGACFQLHRQARFHT